MILALTLRVGYQEAVAIKTALRLAYLKGAGPIPGRLVARRPPTVIGPCPWGVGRKV